MPTPEQLSQPPLPQKNEELSGKEQFLNAVLSLGTPFTPAAQEYFKNAVKNDFEFNPTENSCSDSILLDIETSLRGYKIIDNQTRRKALLKKPKNPTDFYLLKALSEGGTPKNIQNFEDYYKLYNLGSEFSKAYNQFREPAPGLDDSEEIDANKLVTTPTISSSTAMIEQKLHDAAADNSTIIPPLKPNKSFWGSLKSAFSSAPPPSTSINGAASRPVVTCPLPMTPDVIRTKTEEKLDEPENNSSSPSPASSHRPGIS